MNTLYRSWSSPFKVGQEIQQVLTSIDIFDGRVLLTGSYNWSTNAEENSDENAVFIRNSPVIAAYQSNFNAMWSTR